jgi:hypothetical protein
MKHAYWVVRCKTEYCQNQMAVKYIGLHDDHKIHFLPIEMPGWFDISCDKCVTRHRYLHTDLIPVVTEEAPPFDFVDMF